MLYAPSADCATCRGWHPRCNIACLDPDREIIAWGPEVCPECGREVPTIAAAVVVGLSPDVL